MNVTPFARLFQRFVLRDLGRNWLRTTITIAGIALGVCVFLAISIANNTAIVRFNETVDSIAGKANLEISPASGRTLPEDVLLDLRWLWQIDAKFTPVLKESVVVDGTTPELVQLVGVDLLADPDFSSTTGNTSVDLDSTSSKNGVNSVTPAEGSASAPSSSSTISSTGDSSTAAPTIFDDGAVLVGSKLADDHGLTRGKKFQIIIDDRKVQLVVAGVMDGSGLGGAYSGRLIVGDISLIQKILQLPGGVSQIELVIPAEQLAEAEQKLKAEMPATVLVERSSQRNAKVENMTKSFDYNLKALTLIALIVGMFLIYNTMTMSVISRRVEIGTLRALGAGRSRILSMLILEAALFGGSGAAIGVGAGVLLADWSLQAVAQTYQRLYIDVPLESIAIDPALLTLGLIVGMGLTVLASIPPALEGAMVSPIEATRRVSFERKVDRLAIPLAICAAVSFAAGLVVSTTPPPGNVPIFGYLAAMLFVLGATLLTPAFLRLILPVVTIFCKGTFGIAGKLAARSLSGTPGRVSVAIASLTVGIAMMVSLAIMIGSFRQTVMDWVDQTMVADLWVQPAARQHGSDGAAFAATFEERLKAVPGVSAVEPWSEVPIEFRGQPATLGAARFEVVGRFGNLTFVSGRPSKEICAAVAGNRAIVSESFSIRHRLGRGDKVKIPTAGGELEVTIEDIYYDYASDTGYVVVPRQLYEEMLNDKSIATFSVFVEKGVEPESVRKTILATLGQDSLMKIRTTSELRKRVLEVFDKTFAITYALHTIAVIVAILSVMNALFALTIESRREFGVLKFIGMPAKMIGNMILIDAGILGVIGSIAGIALGFILAMLLILVINKQSFGWTVRLSVPWLFLIQSFGLVVAASVMSALVPARMASKTPAPEVVNFE